jgi:hypothetical protein
MVMADKDGVGTKLLKSLVVLGTVGVPAFGGQVLSALLQKHVGFVREAGSSTLGEALVDGGSGAVLGALEVGAAFLIGGKDEALRTLPFALGGAAMCGALPLVDKGIDGLLGVDADVPLTTQQLTVAKTATLQLPTKMATLRKVPGGSDLGETLPGGSDLGETLPGGVPSTRGNASY